MVMVCIVNHSRCRLVCTRIQADLARMEASAGNCGQQHPMGCRAELLWLLMATWAQVGMPGSDHGHQEDILNGDCYS